MDSTSPPSNVCYLGLTPAHSFDEIGNRLSATNNGRVSVYTPNNLNQISTRTVPRAFDVIGKVAAASVTINNLPIPQLDGYFYHELPAGSGAVHVPYSVAATDATGTTTRSGGKFLPASPEDYDYDYDGNLKNDGRFTYTWDAENRLIAMETHPAVPTIAKRKLSFAYDAMGRRIRKTTWHGTVSGTWQLQQDLRFIHELGGWNIQAEIGSDAKFLRTYTWGTDLSGSLSGAGGVGGLLFCKMPTETSSHAFGMDLNGNVSLLVSTVTGAVTATYDYGPFGEPIRESGEYAKLNPYRFSTKYADDETGLLYYGYRYYDPATGRWPSRDPIEEMGGINLYGMGFNSIISEVDYLGMTVTWKAKYFIPASGKARDASYLAAVDSNLKRILKNLDIILETDSAVIGDSNTTWFNNVNFLNIISRSGGQTSLEFIKDYKKNPHNPVLLPDGFRTEAWTYSGLGIIVKAQDEPLRTARMIAHELFHRESKFEHDFGRHPFDKRPYLTADPANIQEYDDPDKEKVACAVAKWLKSIGANPDVNYVEPGWNPN